MSLAGRSDLRMLRAMSERLLPALAQIPLRYLRDHGGIPADIDGAALSSPDGTPVAVQRRLLREVARRGGDGLLLTLGAQMTGMVKEPLLFVMLNARSIADLLDKEQRFNQFFHSHHRIRVLESGQTHVALQHYGLVDTPVRQESLFVLGLHLEMFAAIGCQGLAVSFPQSDAPEQRLSGPPFANPPPGDASCFRIAWKRFVQRREPLPGLDALLLSQAAPRDFAADESIVGRLQRLLATDLAHRWTVAEAAAGLHTSLRSLQRELAAADTAFTREVEQARVAQAKRLLVDPQHSVTEVGYICGFSDGAHFSRRFKAATGVSPAAWRAATKD